MNPAAFVDFQLRVTAAASSEGSGPGWGHVALVLAGAMPALLVAWLNTRSTTNLDHARASREVAQWWKDQRVVAYARLVSALNQVMSLAFEIRDNETPGTRASWRDARVELVQAVATARLLASRPVRDRLENVLGADELAQELVDRLGGSALPDAAEWISLNGSYQSARDQFVDAVQLELQVPRVEPGA